MSTNYEIAQSEQRIRDRQLAIQLAIQKLEDAQAQFKLDIYKINHI